MKNDKHPTDGPPPTPLPAEPKRTSEGQGHSGHPSEKPKAAQERTANVSGGIHPDTAEEQNAKPGQANQYQRQNLAARIRQWVIPAATVGTCIAAIVYAWFAYQQVGEMQRQAVASELAAKAAKDAVIESTNSRIASQAQSKAALDATIALARNDQRAWVNVPDQYGIPELVIGQTVSYKMGFVNTGKTPAWKLRAKVRGEFVFPKPAFTFPEGYYSSFYLGQLPPSYNPAPTVLQIRAGFFASPLDTQMKEIVERGNMYVAIYGELTYGDIAGQHWLRFCKSEGQSPWSDDQGNSRECADYNAFGDGSLPSRIEKRF